jgi:hypothetical protein
MKLIINSTILTDYFYDVIAHKYELDIENTEFVVTGEIGTQDFDDEIVEVLEILSIEIPSVCGKIIEIELPALEMELVEKELFEQFSELLNETIHYNLSMSYNYADYDCL